MHLVGFIIRIYHDALSPERQVPYHNYRYNSLPEGEPSGSKHVEDIEIKI